MNAFGNKQVSFFFLNSDFLQSKYGTQSGRGVSYCHGYPQKQKMLVDWTSHFFPFFFCSLTERLYFCTFLSWTRRQKGAGMKEQYRSRPPVFYRLAFKKKKKEKKGRFFNSHGSERRQRRGQSRGTAETVVGRQWCCGNSNATLRVGCLCELKFCMWGVSLFHKSVI